MTELDPAAVAELAAKATAGDWMAWPDPEGIVILHRKDHGGYGEPICIMGQEDGTFNDDNDAAFICAARNHWPGHAAELVAARKRVAELEAFLRSLLNPEENGHAVNAYVRDEARVLLGRGRVET